MTISEGQWRLGSFRYGVRGKAGKFGHVAGPWRETVDEAVRQQERLKTPEKVQELSEGEYEQQFNSEGDGQQEETETDGLPQWPLTGAAKRRYPSMYSSSLQSQGERGRGRERGGGRSSPVLHWATNTNVHPFSNEQLTQSISTTGSNLWSSDCKGKNINHCTTVWSTKTHQCHVIFYWKDFPLLYKKE